VNAAWLAIIFSALAVTISVTNLCVAVVVTRKRRKDTP
jgi:Na+/proline symporter